MALSSRETSATTLPRDRATVLSRRDSSVRLPGQWSREIRFGCPGKRLGGPTRRVTVLTMTSEPTRHVVKAEPLTAEAFAPFGQLVKEGDMAMELRDGEVFHLNVLHYDRHDLRCDHLNRHHKATQALVALAGKPTLLVVAPKDFDFTSDDHLSHVRAFICDGTAGVNLALGTWHWGPYPI